eukprot:1158894-Pelagomonas_calceolata.AAC.5
MVNWGGAGCFQCSPRRCALYFNQKRSPWSSWPHSSFLLHHARGILGFVQNGCSRCPGPVAVPLVKPSCISLTLVENTGLAPVTRRLWCSWSRCAPFPSMLPISRRSSTGVCSCEAWAVRLSEPLCRAVMLSESLCRRLPGCDSVCADIMHNAIVGRASEEDWGEGSTAAGLHAEAQLPLAHLSTHVPQSVQAPKNTHVPLVLRVYQPVARVACPAAHVALAAQVACPAERFTLAGAHAMVGISLARVRMGQRHISVASKLCDSRGRCAKVEEYLACVSCSSSGCCSIKCAAVVPAAVNQLGCCCRTDNFVSV